MRDSRRAGYDAAGPPASNPECRLPAALEQFEAPFLVDPPESFPRSEPGNGGKQIQKRDIYPAESGDSPTNASCIAIQGFLPDRMSVRDWRDESHCPESGRAGVSGVSVGLDKQAMCAARKKLHFVARAPVAPAFVLSTKKCDLRGVNLVRSKGAARSLAETAASKGDETRAS
jgi:hypothetical protein